MERTDPSQNLKKNMEAGKIKLPPEDAQAVRGVAGKANTAQGDRDRKSVV